MLKLGNPKRWIFLSLGLSLVCACTSRKPFMYAIASPAQHASCIELNCKAKYVLIDDAYSQLLREAMKNVEEGRKREAHKAVTLLSDIGERNFLQGIIKFQDRDFLLASTFFKSAGENGMFQARLLWLDCEAEVGTKLAYYELFQQLYDEAPNGVYQGLVKNHYQYFCYGL